MTDKDKDRIECAIRHIDSCLDVDPWARDIAIDAMKAQLSEEGTTFDLINRQALRLMKAEECAGHTIEYAMGWKACIEWIKTLPSVQPAGAVWVQISPAKIYTCSRCGITVMTDDIEQYKYCHGCGASMGGVQDE